MSVAYRSNTAFNYRKYEEEVQTQELPRTAARARPVAAQRVALFMAAILATAACIGLLYMKAQVSVTQRSINHMQMDIAAAERLNSGLAEQVSEAQNINIVMEKASKLGMGNPKNDQVLYVALAEGATKTEMKNPK